MKLGIVSCYFINNYGSILQAYATQEYFRRSGVQCETVSAERLKPYLSAKRKKYYLHNINKPGLFAAKMPLLKLRLLQRLNYRNLGGMYEERSERFEDFRGRFILSENAAGSLEELKASAEQYDAVLVGSDQLWRPDNIFPEYYTLSWVPDTIPKFSYATSFGVSTLDKRSREKAKSFLSRFSSISVRENSGCDMVKALTGRTPSVVCDPVFLLTRNEWDSIADTSRCPKRKYIFTYFLGNRRECREFAKKLSERTGFPIVGIVHNDAYMAEDELIDLPLAAAAPEEFPGLISKAEYVCTDSFHAAAFSVIYNKSFFVFNRFRSKKHGTNSRIGSFLKILDLENRLMSDPEEAFTADMSSIGYSAVNLRLEEFIKRSKGFIEEHILKGDACSV